MLCHFPVSQLAQPFRHFACMLTKLLCATDVAAHNIAPRALAVLPVMLAAL
jgi:hypothetical protein